MEYIYDLKKFPSASIKESAINLIEKRAMSPKRELSVIAIV